MRYTRFGVYYSYMAIKDFFQNMVLKQQLKNVPEAQREQLMAMINKNPDLWKKIGEEVERRTKGGEPQMKATMEVMKKYREELAKSLQ